MRRGNIVAAAFPLCDRRGKPSSRSMLYRLRIANSVRAAMICKVGSTEWIRGREAEFASLEDRLSDANLALVARMGTLRCEPRVK